MTRNQSKIIPAETLGAVSDWTFAAVDQYSDKFAAKLRVQEAHDFAQKEELLRQAGFAQGMAEGFAQGHAQGVLEGQQKLDAYIAKQGKVAAHKFGQLFVAAGEQLEQQEQAIAQGVLDMALLVARQVLRQELSVNPNVLMPVVREALSLLVADQRATVVRLHPVDLDVFAETIRESFPGLTLTLVPDGTLRQGGCLVECAGTVVDGTLQNRWKKALASVGLQMDWEGEGDGD